MIIDCIADLHGDYPTLDGGDLLIVAGDLTASDKPEQYFEFEEWLDAQCYKKKVLIAGNHDNFLVDNGPHMFAACDYLCDSGMEFEGMKIWGSPWTKTFKGINPHCKAFTVDTEDEIAVKWALIPDDTDILITHGPPASVLDKTYRGMNVGSASLMAKASSLSKMRLHIFGHIHESHGILKHTHADGSLMRCYINCSYVNDDYDPVNKPVRIIL